MAPLSGTTKLDRSDRLRAIYRTLDRPCLYGLAQVLFAPGQPRRLTRIFSATAKNLPSARRILDVGCGSSSWLWRLGLRPVGLDITPSYTARFALHGDPVVIASSTAIPFADAIFDQAWCFGLLHHLSDEEARQTLAEMRRVTAAGGALVVMDAVLPRSPRRRPLAYLIRKLDRGAYVRSEANHRALLGERWTVRRELMAYTGLEVTVAVARA
jgi:SAM-dependent methyltransferase